MTYQRAIIIGAALIAAAVVMNGGGSSTEGRSVGRYQIQAMGATNLVWMVDTATGGLRVCVPPRRWMEKVVGRSTERTAMSVEEINVGAECSPWGLIVQ